MLEILHNFFISGPFVPHGHCYLWKPGLVGLHIISDSLIALAYFSIPILLVYFVRKRQDLPFNWIFLLFGSFIVACGTTHVIEVWTLWHPTYWLSGSIKAITALVSVYTALELVSLIPQALAIPSPAQLEDTNRQLEIEINERVLVEKALHESQQMLQLVMDNIPQLIFWKDRNSVYLGCNQNFARVAGVGRSENIVGKTDYDLPWKQEESDWFRKCDAHVMETNKPEYHIIESQLQADGKQSWIDTSKIPLHDAEGNVVGILGTYEDITERKQAEDTLRQSETQLRQQTAQLEQAMHELRQTQSLMVQKEKMSSLGQLVAGVAHEINNPVNFIYGNLTHAGQYTQSLLELLHLYQQHYPYPVSEIQAQAETIDINFLLEDLPKILSSMKLGADRIRQIVQSLRNFSRLDQADMKLVDIHEGIDSTLLILQSRLKANGKDDGIEVIKEYGNLPKVECYAGQLNQVFMNLLTNAIDALKEGISSEESKEYSSPLTPQRDSGRINLNGSSREKSISPHLPPESSPSPVLRISTEVRDSDRVVIRIIDNGPGMTEKVSQRLFDPFFTTKPVGSGTGLGLSISYQIVVEKHGGQLMCISSPGKGAEFLVEIPIRRLEARCVLPHAPSPTLTSN